MNTLLAPKIITELYVKERYENILAEVTKVVPLSNWALHPTNVSFTRHKTKYGWSRKDGSIEVNQCFLGTQSVNKLDATIRHELAHLCCGLTHGHGRVFQRTAMLFGVRDSAVPKCEVEELLAKIPFKYDVYAHLENGERVHLGGVHKKTKKYTQYDARDPHKGFSIKGVRIESFEFIDIV